MKWDLPPSISPGKCITSTVQYQLDSATGLKFFNLVQGDDAAYTTYAIQDGSIGGLKKFRVQANAKTGESSTGFHVNGECAGFFTQVRSLPLRLFGIQLRGQ